jgi:lanosterol synthase
MWNALDIAPTAEMPFTDYTRWRLHVGDGGRQTWHYLQTDEELERWPQTEVERFWLGMKTVRLWPPFSACDSIFVPV